MDLSAAPQRLIGVASTKEDTDQKYARRLRRLGYEPVVFSLSKLEELPQAHLLVVVVCGCCEENNRWYLDRLGHVATCPILYMRQPDSVSASAYPEYPSIACSDEALLRTIEEYQGVLA